MIGAKAYTADVRVSLIHRNVLNSKSETTSSLLKLKCSFDAFGSFHLKKPRP